MLFFVDLAKQYLLHYGIWGVGLGMMIESLGVPVVSTVLELSSGALIINQGISPLLVIFIADLGIVIGSAISYFLGYYGFPLIKKAEKRELYTKKELEVRENIQKHGLRVIFIAQLVGPMRTWISYPAGALKIDFKKFIFYTATGGLFYSTLVVGVSTGVVSFLKQDIKLIENIINRYIFFDMTITLIITVIVTYFLLKTNGNNGKAKDATLKD